ncbi:MAG: transglutaminase domain-containing protein [Kofleriaceae bacterium]
MRSRRSVALGTLAAAAVGAALWGAASYAGAPRPVLHERLPSPRSGSSPLFGETGGDDNPAAMAAGDKVLPAPSLDKAPRRDDEPVLGTRDFGADRDTSAQLDRDTDADGTLHYASVFNPDVLPFKRMSALDAVQPSYTLVVARGDQTDLPVGGGTDPSRDRFWGSMLIRLSPGAEIALPSVAPDMRILSYETEPKVRLVFSKDGADNFFVRSDDSGSAGTYRLVFLADADAGYFAPSLPTGSYTPAEVARLAPAELRTPIPPEVMADAKKVFDRIDVRRTQSLGEAFNRLVNYFRAFEAKDLPQGKDNLYLQLCYNQAGVCRHRAFAFMVTANALGIPTRFVTNEAHAFVEVWFPERNWQRVDLGGAALRLEVSGGEDKTLHRPRSEDPFAKPQKYRENYTQLEGDIRGLRGDQIRDRQRPTSDAPASGSFDGTEPSTPPDEPPADLGGRITPNRSLEVATPDPKKATPVLVITRADATTYRGGTLHVEGRATANGEPLAGHPIDVFLSTAGLEGRDADLLQRIFTAADGTFAADLKVPHTRRLAPHELHVSSPEDARYNGALSE